MKKLLKMFNSKKGQVMDQLGSLGIGIATLVIILAVVFLIMSNVLSNSQVAADANATAAVQTLTTAAATIPTWVPLVVIVAIGALILGLVQVFRQR